MDEKELTENIIAAEEKVILPESNIKKCLSCGTEYEGNFCPTCGQSAKVGRLSVKRILSETLPDIYNLDNRIVRTCVDLFRRPGHMIKDYLDGNRVKYSKPVSLLFVLATVYLVVAHICNVETSHPFNPDWTFHINNQDVRFIPEGSFLEKIIKYGWDLYWNKAWSTIMTVTLLLIPMKFSFRKTELGKTLNYAEYFFIMIFLNCQTLIIDTFVLFWNLIFDNEFIKAYTDAFVINGSQNVICFVMAIWSLKQLYKISIRKSFFNYLEARIIFVILFVITFIIILTILAMCGTFDVLKDLEPGSTIDFGQELKEALED